MPVPSCSQSQKHARKGGSIRGMTGTVKSFNARRGYGFIGGPDGEDILVHYSAIEAEGFRALRRGEMVQYDAVSGPRGWSALRVRRLEREDPHHAVQPSANGSAVRNGQ